MWQSAAVHHQVVRNYTEVQSGPMANPLQWLRLTVERCQTYNTVNYETFFDYQGDSTRQALSVA